MLSSHMLDQVSLSKEPLPVDTLATGLGAREWCLIMLMTHVLSVFNSRGEEQIVP